MQRLIEQLPLRPGSHVSRDDGMCAMEMVAWLAGEAHSDEPECACPVVAAIVRAMNDAMCDSQREQYLRPLVPHLVHSRGSAAVQRQRGMLALDCLVRVILPLRLMSQGRRDEALLLRELPKILGRQELCATRRLLQTFASDQRAALWVLDRALDGMPPERFVAATVQVCRECDGIAVWPHMVSLLHQLVSTTPVAASTTSVTLH